MKKNARVAVCAIVWAIAFNSASAAPPASDDPPVTTGIVTPFPSVEATATGKKAAPEKIADGIFLSYGTAADGGGSNSIIVIGDDEVLVVDTKMTSLAAASLLEQVKNLAPGKPIRFAVNTHHHYDHTNGNSVFRAAGIDVIGHEFVSYAIDNYDNAHREPLLTSMVARRIGQLERKLAAEAEPEARAMIDSDLLLARQTKTAMEAIRSTAPNVTYRDKKVINLGNREVQLLFFGRAHTNGDTVVYLPKEKIVCVADLVGNAPSFMGDGQFSEWIVTLERVKALDADVLLPGHGKAVYHAKAQIAAYQGYLKELVSQVTQARKQGIPAIDIAPKLDLSAYREAFPDAARPSVPLRDVRRIYEWLYEQEHR